MKEAKTCRGCGGFLFHIVRLKGGYWALHEDTPFSLKTQEDIHYFQCPHCSGKNIAYLKDVPEGTPPQFWIVRFQK